MMPLDDVADLLALPGEPDEDEEVQTLGGLVMARLGRIPAVGDQFAWAGHSFEVVDMDGRRVDKVLALTASHPAAHHTDDERP